MKTAGPALALSVLRSLAVNSLKFFSALTLLLAPQANRSMLCAQNVSFGVVSGTSISRDFRTLHYPFTFETRTYTDSTLPGPRSQILGPMLEVDLPRQFSVEVNALHRNLRYTTSSDFPGTPPSAATVSTWQFPVLLKYRFQVKPRLLPFLAAGPSFRTYSNPAGSRPSRFGAAGAVGLDVALGKFRISPSLRYTRWASDKNVPFRPTIPNQLEFLVATSYSTEAGLRSLRGRKIWLGVIVGVPITNDFTPIDPRAPPYTGASSRIADFRFVAGLRAEIPFSSKLALEWNGIYRRLHFEDGPEVVLTWQFPVLLKYTFSGVRIAKPNLRPFVQAGPSFRLAGNLNGTDPSNFGFTAGIGAEIDASRVRFTPSVRYTRWAHEKNKRFTTQPLTKPDEIAFLVGISF